ncbi:MAG: hypothetical protein Q7K55_03310 [Candidatus Levybacteria bacterium]|nr:hypothetical protein [Candidatus Levybacteria bacterium]
MKLKLALITVFLSIFGLIMLNQIGMVNAQNASSALTGPITRPVTYFTYKISGKATYRFLLSINPAKNVLIEAKNIKSNEKYTVNTDLNGNYTLYVKNGQYLVKASDTKKTVFMPNYQYVNAVKDTLNINFQGILRYR